jgi:hypothetical protein
LSHRTISHRLPLSVSVCAHWNAVAGSGVGLLRVVLRRLTRPRPPLLYQLTWRAGALPAGYQVIRLRSAERRRYSRRWPDSVGRAAHLAPCGPGSCFRGASAGVGAPSAGLNLHSSILRAWPRAGAGEAIVWAVYKLAAKAVWHVEADDEATAIEKAAGGNSRCRPRRCWRKPGEEYTYSGRFPNN